MGDGGDEGDAAARDGGDAGSSDAEASDASVPSWVTLGGGVWVSPSCPGPGQALDVRYAGTLSDETGLTIHYGYDGWSEVAGSIAGPGTGDGTDYYFEEEMIKDGQGGFLTSLSPPAGSRAVHMVFRSESGIWDNGASKDYNLGLSFPYLGPFVTWNEDDDPSTALQVNFHSGYLCIGEVDYGTGGVLSSRVTGSSAAVIHHLRIDGLAPSTEVSFRVRCRDRDESPVYTVRTASQSSLTMAVISDAQDSGEAPGWETTAAALQDAHPEVEMLLIAGDLAWNDRPGLWWLFFDRARELLATHALAVIPGNHDVTGSGGSRDDSTIRDLLGLETRSDLVRRLEWGPAALLLLDTGAPDEFAISGGSQYAWTAATLDGLALDPFPPAWTFAAMHIPPYNAGARHYSEQGAFRDLTGLFDGRVDWVFAGHEHLYQRMLPLSYNGVLAPSGQYGRNPDDGVGYLILPPAGAWPETQLIHWEDPKAYYRDRLAFPVPVQFEDTVPSENGYVVVRITETTLGIETFAVRESAVLIDELFLEK